MILDFLVSAYGALASRIGGGVEAVFRDADAVQAADAGGRFGEGDFVAERL